MGFEALVRWRNPATGEILPGEFIPLAEDVGLVVPIGRFVFVDACRRLAEWRRRAPLLDLRMHVNLSVQEVLEPDLDAFVARNLRRFGLSSDDIVLEITESAVIRSNTLSLGSLARLRATGVHLCIDDFGTGYSSLRYLHQLPFDALKIDRSFVESADGSLGSPPIVRMLIQLARSYDIDVVAEGVETAAPGRRADGARLPTTRKASTSTARCAPKPSARCSTPRSRRPGLSARPPPGGVTSGGPAPSVRYAAHEDRPLSPGRPMSDDAERFEPHRRTLTRLAYRLLGSNAEAEDVVQDAYVRWHDALARTAVADDAAYLRATVTRLALDRLRSARAARETYVGPWLPEPVLDDAASDPEAMAALAEDVSFALMLALERLSPLERAAFILHDVLDVPFAEIATTLDRSEDAVRRLASRARDHVRTSRAAPRPEARRRDPHARRVRRGAARRRCERPDPAARRRRRPALRRRRQSARRDQPAGRPRPRGPLPDRRRRQAQRRDARVVPALLNGTPGFVVFGAEAGFERVIQTMAIESDGERITALYVTRNPDKLRGLAAHFASPL